MISASGANTSHFIEADLEGIVSSDGLKNYEGPLRMRTAKRKEKVRKEDDRARTRAEEKEEPVACPIEDFAALEGWGPIAGLGNYSIKRRRQTALSLAIRAMRSNKANVDRTFGVSDWRVLIHDALHNSDGRPKARGRKEGKHWTAWAFDLKSNRSVFYLHLYEDGRVAKFGADTRKAFRMADYDLLWSGEVTAK